MKNATGERPEQATPVSWAHADETIVISSSVLSDFTQGRLSSRTSLWNSRHNAVPHDQQISAVDEKHFNET